LRALSGHLIVEPAIGLQDNIRADLNEWVLIYFYACIIYLYAGSKMMALSLILIIKIYLVRSKGEERLHFNYINFHSILKKSDFFFSW